MHQYYLFRTKGIKLFACETLHRTFHVLKQIWTTYNLKYWSSALTLKQWQCRNHHLIFGILICSCVLNGTIGSFPDLNWLANICRCMNESGCIYRMSTNSGILIPSSQVNDPCCQECYHSHVYIVWWWYFFAKADRETLHLDNVNTCTDSYYLSSSDKFTWRWSKIR